MMLGFDVLLQCAHFIKRCGDVSSNEDLVFTADVVPGQWPILKRMIVVNSSILITKSNLLDRISS